jgi:hypothetical protein
MSLWLVRGVLVLNTVAFLTVVGAAIVISGRTGECDTDMDVFRFVLGVYVLAATVFLCHYAVHVAERDIVGFLLQPSERGQRFIRQPVGRPEVKIGASMYSQQLQASYPERAEKEKAGQLMFGWYGWQLRKRMWRIVFGAIPMGLIYLGFYCFFTEDVRLTNFVCEYANTTAKVRFGKNVDIVAWDSERLEMDQRSETRSVRISMKIQCNDDIANGTLDFGCDRLADFKVDYNITLELPQLRREVADEQRNMLQVLGGLCGVLLLSMLTTELVQVGDVASADAAVAGGGEQDSAEVRRGGGAGADDSASATGDGGDDDDDSIRQGSTWKPTGSPGAQFQWPVLVRQRGEKTASTGVNTQFGTFLSNVSGLGNPGRIPGRISKYWGGGLMDKRRRIAVRPGVGAVLFRVLLLFGQVVGVFLALVILTNYGVCASEKWSPVLMDVMVCATAVNGGYMLLSVILWIQDRWKRDATE